MFPEVHIQLVEKKSPKKINQKILSNYFLRIQTERFSLLCRFPLDPRKKIVVKQKLKGIVCVYFYTRRGLIWSFYLYYLARFLKIIFSQICFIDENINELATVFFSY